MRGFFSVSQPERIQTATAKLRMVCDLPIFQILNHLPFDLCHLPFELFVVVSFTFRHLARSAVRGRDPSPVALRLMKTPAARHPLPKGEGCRFTLDPWRPANDVGRVSVLAWGIDLGVRGANGPGANFQFSGRCTPLHLAMKTSVVLENLGYVGVLGTQGFLPDRERSLEERLGLGVRRLDAAFALHRPSCL